jgi:hypothetical protein
MLFQLDNTAKKKARAPHELFMFNLAVFHLMFAPISVFLMRDVTALLIPLTFSSVVIAYIFIQGKRTEANGPWFVMVHWKLAFRRAVTLLIGYALTALIIGGGALLAMSSDKASMQDIIITISSRIGIMPTFIMVVVNFVLESGSIYQAGRGEIHDSMVKRYPAPEDLVVLETPPQTA